MQARGGMKILFVFPRWTGEYGLFSVFAKRGAVYQPLNLAMLAAIAEASGHEAAIIDAQAENLDNEAVARRVKAFAPDAIGLTATTPFFHVARRCAELFKERFPLVPLVLGGPHITILKQEAFAPCFDYACIGEAEQSFPALLETLAAGGEPAGVKGIMYRKDGAIVFTGQADPVTDIDSLPVPARHLLHMDKYMLGSLKTGRKRFTPIMTMRGCPFHCIFCSTDVFGRTVRKRSPAKVIAEIKGVVERFGTRHFMFLDDTLTLDKGHILSICRQIVEQNLDITFEGSTR
ncbi:MAG: cobalamin-dependent protein, partial [Desulfovibrionaceae bacterium]|nr:cobalamin-dependent protein [Desulfovibrionaceae bacterium]